MSVFFRWRFGSLYREERWRENGKMRSKSRVVWSRRRSGGGGASSPGMMVPALPFMIAADLITGSRVEKLKEQLAQPDKPSVPAMAWAREKYTPPSLEEMHARAAKHTPTVQTPEEKEAWAKFNAWVDSPSSKLGPSLQEKAVQEYKDLEARGSFSSPVDKEIDAREQAFEKHNDEYVETENAIDAAAPDKGEQDGKDGGQDADGEADGEV